MITEVITWSDVLYYYGLGFVGGIITVIVVIKLAIRAGNWIGKHISLS